ncbi:hypothetical protein LCGC14_1893070, partial [marine sediment metagenome]
HNRLSLYTTHLPPYRVYYSQIEKQKRSKKHRPTYANVGTETDKLLSLNKEHLERDTLTANEAIKVRGTD